MWNNYCHKCNSYTLFVKPVIAIASRTYVPVEYLQHPELSLFQLTFTNGSRGRAGDPESFLVEAEALRDAVTDRILGVFFPRALDIRPHLKPGVTPVVEVEWLGSDMWPHIQLGTKDPQLGPNDFIAYDQRPAWENLVAAPYTWPFGRQLILACGRGKTCLSLKLAQYRAVPTLVVCHTLNMAQQWSQEAENFLGYPREKHGFIGDGEVDWATKDLVFSSMPGLTCRPYPEEFWYKFGLVIFDEGDMFGSMCNSQTLRRFVGERLFVTATPDRSDGNSVLFPLHVGPECFRDTSDDTLPEVWGVQTPTVPELPFPTKTGRGSVKYKSANQTIKVRGQSQPVPNIPKTVSVLSEWAPRREWCLGLVLEQLQEGRKILFLGDRVDELKWFHAEFSASPYRDKYTSGLILGKTHTDLDETQAALHCDIIWAIQQLGKRGLNNRKIDTVVMEYATFRDPGKLAQFVGRCTRYYPDKKFPRVIVLIDKPSYALYDNAVNVIQQLQSKGSQVTWYEYAAE